MALSSVIVTNLNSGGLLVEGSGGTGWASHFGPAPSDFGCCTRTTPPLPFFWVPTVMYYPECLFSILTTWGAGSGAATVKPVQKTKASNAKRFIR